MLLLGLMGMMAGAALLFALKTVTVRRDRDFRPKATAPIAPVAARAVRTHELSALRYLPPDCNMVLAADVAHLQSHPAGEALLRDWKEKNPAIHTAWAGLQPEDIDHLVAGALFSKDRSRLVFVCEAKKPFDVAEVRKALKANRKVESSERPIYRFPLALGILPPIDAFLWCPSDRTVVMSLQLEDVTLQDEDGLRLPISPAMRAILQDRLQGPPAWLIALTPPWDFLLTWIPPDRLPAADRDLLRNSPALALGLNVDRDSLRLRQAHQLAQPRDRESWTRVLEKWTGGKASLTFSNDSAWVTATTTFPLNDVKRLFGEPTRIVPGK